MFCQNCGTAVTQGNSHCTGCGTAVVAASTAAIGSVASQAARQFYDGMDQQLKTSLMWGGGAVLALLLTFIVPAVLAIILLPATIGLAIMALNSGRGLANATGYYLGMMAMVMANALLFFMLCAYWAVSQAQSMAGGMLSELL
jgi:hypothetical protein